MTYSLRINFVEGDIDGYEFVNITEGEKEQILKQFLAGNILTITDHDDDTVYYINPRNIVSLYFDEE